MGLRRFLRKTIRSGSVLPWAKPPAQLSQRGLVLRLATLPSWEDKIAEYRSYRYCQHSGMWNLAEASVDSPIKHLEAHKVNYGCGSDIHEGWLNVDLYESNKPGYLKLNLLEKHPFEDSSVQFGFSEDMLEHLTQAESIFFLSEVYRCLRPGGVLRLSFPGLEGVLSKHYYPATEQRVREGEFEAYSFWGHIHFFSKSELKLVAKHLGFKEIEFVGYGESRHQELTGLDTRLQQIGLNTYVELTR